MSGITEMDIKRKLLIVDDQEINRKILAKFLSAEYCVFSAENGQRALEILNEQKESISAVLLDIVMPVLDGYGVLKEMHKDAFLSKIPVIVTTQQDEDETELKALSLGAEDFVVKPYNPDIIRQRLKNLIGLRETTTLVNIVEKDTLTGIYNKDSFYQRAAEKLIRHAEEQFDIIAMDIERFKLINDTYGAAEGDKLLQYIALKLSRGIQPYGGICARLGGDQFVVLFPRNRNNVDRLVQTTMKELKKYPLDINIVMKFGIYQIEDRTVPITAMCDRAILAVKEVKGKYDEYYTYYDDSIRKRLLLEQQITDEMKTALQQEQFQVYLQPKYDLVSKKIAGAEALVRWIHPQRGFLSPADFIPLFEKNGFITELDLYIWDKTCEILAQWIHEHQKYVPISVNVSRKDIYSPNLPETLLNIVKKHGLKPKHLHLEITETAYTENQDQLIRVVEKLKELGFVIEMDDFGSGYSSLNMLSELPIDILKLDLKFIQNETETNNRNSILSFIISLAKWMNLLVVAEGVETEDQVKLLRNMACNYVQGYHFAKPMPSCDFSKLLMHSDVLQQSDMKFKNNIHSKGNGKISIGERKSAKVMLIVDDIKLNRDILSDFFSQIYTVVEADNGAVALEYILQHYSEISIILLDLVMPVMDGFQLLKRLKTDPLLSNIPVIATSQMGDCSEAKVLEMGACDFITKPYNMDVVIRRVHNALTDRNVRFLEREKEMLMRMRQIEKKARTDVLTGLSNRADLENEVTDFFSNQFTPQAVFFILDIDNFKGVNDSLGHIKGDETLRHVAEILRTCFRENDIICRMGGDEFAVFVPASFSNEELQYRLTELCEKLRFQMGGIPISCSIGACRCPEFGQDYQTLYQNADVALLAAKRGGKDQFQIFGGEVAMHIPSRNISRLLDESSDALTVCDIKNYKLLYINDIACQITGKDKKISLGKKCYEVLWDRKAPCDHCIPVHELTKDYRIYEVTFPNGKEYTVKSKKIDWNGTDARIHYIQGHIHHVRHHNTLSPTSKRLAAVIDAVQTPFIKFKQEGWLMQEANEKFFELIGYTKNEFERVFGNRLSGLIDQECLEIMKMEMESQLITSNEIEFTTYLIKKNQETVLVTLHSVAITEEDSLKYFYSLVVPTKTAIKREKFGEIKSDE